MKPVFGRGQVPEGLRDVLFEEAAARRELEGRLLETYHRWGYREVATPTLELLDAVLPGAGGLVQDELYKLIDRRGRILALRPDMTTPIARLVGTHLTAYPLPLRLGYSAPVFRYQDQGNGRPHEVWQSGVELVGAGGAESDAEVIGLAAEALHSAGLRSFALSLSHSRILPGIMEQCQVAPEARPRLRQALVDRDLVGYGQAVRELGLPAGRQALMLMPTALLEARQAAQLLEHELQQAEALQAVAEVRRVLSLLDQYGPDLPVQFDLGLTRGLDYYTGIIFEAYAPGSGFAVAGGGRYDRLLRAFGEDLPATGFALDLDLLLSILMRTREAATRSGLDLVIAAEAGQEPQAFARAQAFRRAGRAVVVWTGDAAGAAEFAARQGAQCVLLDALGGELAPPASRNRAGGRPLLTTTAGIH